MNHKVVISAVLIALLSGLTFSQLGAPVVKAAPITSPITSAFSVGGKIVLRNLLFRIFGGPSQQPAVGVTVQAESFFTHQIISTQTDADGMYSFDLTAGKYFIKLPVHTADQVAAPPLKFVDVQHDQSNINFQVLNLSH